MTVLVAGLIIFFAVHSISIVNEPWRDRVVARIGEGPWMGLCSLAAMVGLVLMIWGSGMECENAVALYYVPGNETPGDGVVGTGISSVAGDLFSWSNQQYRS